MDWYSIWILLIEQVLYLVLVLALLAGSILNTNPSCPVGAEFDFFQTSSVGNLLFEADPGVTINSKNSNLNLAGQFSSATLKCIDTDEWDLMGDLT